jgi:hypothetical protein
MSGGSPLRYSGTNQYFVQFPNSGHAVTRNSPTTQASAAPHDWLHECGWQVVESFLSDPSKAPDTSCIGNTAPRDWGSPPSYWLSAVGITDLWENAAPDGGGDAAGD